MKVKHYAILLAPLCVVGAAFRFMEIIYAIEPESGFYVQHNPIPVIFNIISLIAALFFLSVLIFVPKEKKSINRRFSRILIIERIAMMTCSIVITASSLKNFLDKVLNQSRYTSISVIFKDLDFYALIFSLLAAFFVVAYVTSPRKVMKSTFFKLISLSFALYYVIRLIMIFIDSSSLLSRAYGAYTILFLSFASLFFINFSKMLIGTPSKKFILAFGFSSVYFGCVRIADTILMALPKNPYNIQGNLLVYISDLFTVLAILAIVLRIVVRRRRREVNITGGTAKRQRAVIINDEENNEEPNI